jgi:hypothetical protein
VQADVRRVQREDKGTLRIWVAGCEFHAITRADSDRIVQFIFAQQRALAARVRGK